MRREINIPAPADADRICDFCSGTPVHQTYAAADIDYPGERYASAGDWCACRACHEMIGRNDRRGLAERMADKFTANYPEAAAKIGRSQLLVDVARIHQSFFDARKGVKQ